MNIKQLLKQYNLRPNKVMGQNFLINQKALLEIVQTADISKQDNILEIGPGLGILTKELAQKAKKIVAIEKDKRMVEILKNVLKDYENIELIHGDVLKTKDFKLKNYKVVANIPYYLTSPMTRMFLESANPPQEMILMIQKEVAQRICAKPPKMNLLAVSVQFYAKPKIISYVSKSSFWPQPKVDSAIIKISDINKPKNVDIKKFFQIVKAGFSKPRKQLVNNLPREATKKALAQCGLSTQARAANLSVSDWRTIARVIS
jgi:16S rRNA (adenine1518-N6/adenine1519-N6)-dimethyltransferase